MQQKAVHKEKVRLREAMQAVQVDTMRRNVAMEQKSTLTQVRESFNYLIHTQDIIASVSLDPFIGPLRSRNWSLA